MVAHAFDEIHLTLACSTCRHLGIFRFTDMIKMLVKLVQQLAGRFGKHDNGGSAFEPPQVCPITIA